MNPIEELIAKLPSFEGSIPFMYRDTAGHITVGTGRMLPSVEAAVAIPFLVSGRAATQEEIAAEFTRLTSMPYGHQYAAHWFDSPESPVISDETNRDLLRSYVTNEAKQLAAALPCYADLPDNCKLALLDMAYNLGVHGLLNGFPHLIEAVQQGNWQASAAFCIRPQLSMPRNDWTRGLFSSEI